ncbi:MAG: hypothetical protein ACRCW2_09195 [Cellulosilyticaceae bacterium]
MLDRKWQIYVVHHSHTDIGYTDLQEKILYNHVDYIREACQIGRPDFKWNCETYYCVERFFEEATDAEKEHFYNCVKDGTIGLSANYLNFTDLADKSILTKRTQEMVDLFATQNIDVKVAMNADINGISLGQLDAYLDNGIEFLYTNIHCHHGMYPLYQNQKPYFWSNKAGKKMLVWSGEHYNLGNALGLVPAKHANYMTETYFGKDKPASPMENLKKNLYTYLEECTEYGYAHSFMPLSVSGVFSDNAPPNVEIADLIAEFNAAYGEEVTIKMVTLEELYAAIKDELQDVETYTGDLNDWWAHGVGSTPYSVKHYKDAQRLYHLCERLDPENKWSRADFKREAEDNLLVFAEHTWGHSSTITNPYDTMVQNLDIRKTSYASKAHEASAKVLTRIMHARGDKLRYYDREGKIKAINVSGLTGEQIVEFYIEVWGFDGVEIVSPTGEVLTAQVSSHPRGVLITFVDTFEAGEEKNYTFKEVAKTKEKATTRTAYTGSERVKDIVNTFDPLTYTLPYGIESDFFKISYTIGEGVTSFYNKAEGVEMLLDGDKKFFTPIYERTAIRTDVYEERRLVGRNIRGLHAEKFIGDLTHIKIIDNGAVFKTIELTYNLEGTFHSSVVIKMFNHLPIIDFKYKLAKTLATDVENIMLPLALNLPKTELYIDKGDVAMRPGIDQLPGTGMEYYLIDNGVVYTGENHNLAIQTLDAPMVYMGELKHHEILLCDNKVENNQRPVYSWIMNNIWETNFKMDLSGITEFCYRLSLTAHQDADTAFEALKGTGFGTVSFMTK